MNKRVVIKWGSFLAVAVVIVAMAVHFFLPKENKELNAPVGGGVKKKTLNVVAHIVRPKTLTDALQISGRILPDEEVNLSFESSGKVVSINFKEGSHVKAGQLLAKVNDAPLQAQLRQLEAQLKLANNRVYRQNALLEKEAVSKEALEQVKTELAMLEAQIDQKKAEIAQTEMKAPFEGIIGLRKVSVGAYASPSTVVATLTKIRPLKIEFSVPERYSGVIRSGSKLAFTVEGDLKARQATVYATDSRVDTETHTFTVRADYANADGAILPGRFANIEVTNQQINNAIAIPSEAVIAEMGIDKVFVYRNGAAQPVEIVKGLRTESEVQVLKGLSAGDTIITTGTMQLRTGQQVKLDRIE